MLLAATSAQAHIDNDGPDSDIRPPDGATITVRGGDLPVTARFRGDCDDGTRVGVDLMTVREPAARVMRDSFSCAAGEWTWRGRLHGLAGGGQCMLVLDFEQWGAGETAVHHFHGRDATWTLRAAAAPGG